MTAKLPGGNSPLVSSDYLRLAYTAMLFECSADDICAFWHCHPIETADAHMNARESLELLWSSNDALPLQYGIAVLNDLEWFLIERGYDTRRFFTALYNLGKGVTALPQTVLALLAPFCELLYRHSDLRRLYLDKLHLLNERIRPGTIHRLIKHEGAGDWNTATVLMILDRRFDPQFPALDAELFLTGFLRRAPVRLGLKPFEKAAGLSECRTLEQAAAPAQAHRRGESGAIQGEIIGEYMPFSRFCQKHDLDLRPFDVPDREVFVAHRDYWCPYRGRIAILKGCAYGAPVYLTRLTYAAQQARPENPLAGLIEEVAGISESVRPRAEQLHQDILRRLSRRIDIEFFSEAQVMTINRKPLARGASALMIRKIIKAYKHEGRREFEHRDFAHDSAIAPDSGNPNVAVRLRRIEQTLRKKLPEIRITKKKRGLFAVAIREPISYHEK